MKCWKTYPFFRLIMSKLRAVFLLAVTATLLMIANLPEATEASCWKTWSRCTEWSHFFTGKIWTKCDPYCKCLGRSGGRCVISKWTCPFADKAWSCHCYESYGPRQTKWCGFLMSKTYLKDDLKIAKWFIDVFFY